MKYVAIAVVILLAGCSHIYGAVPYLPAAKYAYCAAATEEARESIRERHNLPHVIKCAGDD